MGTGSGRGTDNGTGALNVNGGVDHVVEGADDAGEMDDGVNAGKCLTQGSRLERYSNDGGAASHLARRFRSDDGADIDPAPDEVRDQVLADETRRASHGYRQAHVSAF
jgi:hypothetical protein